MDLESLVKKHKPAHAELEIYYEVSAESSFLCMNGNISSKESREFEGFGIRLCDPNGRLGFSYCQNESLIPSSIQRAQKLISGSAPCAGYEFPTSNPYPKAPSNLSSEIKKIKNTEPQDLISMFEDFISSCQKDGTIALEGNFSAEYSESSIANSNGIFASDSGASISASMQTKYNDNSSSAICASQYLSDFISGSVLEGAKSSQLAREISNAGHLDSGKYPVVFELPALHSLIFEILLPSFDGDSVLQKSSLLAGNLGKKMFSDSISMYDDPSDTRGFFSAFDGEGVASSKKSLVENGVVSGFLLDSRTAAFMGECGKAKIGNCARSSFQSVPSCGESNIIIDADSNSSAQSDLAKQYLEVHSFHGTHTANMTTGDFSVISDMAFVCNPKNAHGISSKGAKSRIPVKNVMISGNVFSLFNNLSFVDKSHGRFLNLISPRIMFEDVVIVGSN